MMRNIFVLFVGINIIVFLMYFYMPEDKQSAIAPLPANVSQLVLLSEVDKASLISERKEEPEIVSPVLVQEKKAEVDRCYTIGPFKEKNRAEEFSDAISVKVTKTGIRERKEKLQWRFWVYLPDPGGRKKAVNLASELARKGLTDYYVIARGDNKNSISLGHFKDKSLAEKRFAAIKAMKFQPKMDSIEKEYTLYWLDYTAKEGRELGGQELESYELDESIRQFNRECKK